MVRTTNTQHETTETGTETRAAQQTVAQMVATPAGPRERQPLRTWRERAGWSQEELARRASTLAETRGAELGWDKSAVTLSAVASIEQGRVRPTLDTALILAETFGVLVQQIAWPSLAEVQAHPNSRHSRYAQAKAQAGQAGKE